MDIKACFIRNDHTASFSISLIKLSWFFFLHIRYTHSKWSADTSSYLAPGEGLVLYKWQAASAWTRQDFSVAAPLQGCCRCARSSQPAVVWISQQSWRDTPYRELHLHLSQLWADMVSLINLDLVMAVWSLKRRSSSNGRTRKCHPTWIENVPPPLFKVHVGWVWLVSVLVAGAGLLHPLCFLFF